MRHRTFWIGAEHFLCVRQGSKIIFASQGHLGLSHVVRTGRGSGHLGKAASVLIFLYLRRPESHAALKKRRILFHSHTEQLHGIVPLFFFELLVPSLPELAHLHPDNVVILFRHRVSIKPPLLRICTQEVGQIAIRKTGLICQTARALCPPPCASGGIGRRATLRW